MPNFYRPTILLSTRYRHVKKRIRNTIKKIRNLGILNKFLNGVKITKINPVTLLIKNRG